MPYLTPEDLPEGRDCRALFIPANSEWLAIVSGAITELTRSYNWQQFGSVTVAEAVAAMQTMVDEYYEGCSGGDCTNPGGLPIIRININGKVEILIDGEYVEPTEGDYFIPPPEAREGGSPDDQMCLAAKNAVNVLEQLYENLSESWASELSLDAAIIQLLEKLVALGLITVATVTGALAIPLIAFFALVYELLAYLTADLWTEDFTKKLVCVLLDCASNDAGVITFDWDCIESHLNGLATDDGFNEVQTRLNLQIGYILQFIGGVDALNLAASTTEITNDDCSYCGAERFCIEIVSPIEGLDPITDCSGAPNTWAQSFQVALNDSGSSGIFQIDRVEMDVQYTGAGIPAGEAYFAHSNFNCTLSFYEVAGVAAAGMQHFVFEPTDWTDSVNRLSFWASCSNNESNSLGNVLQIKRIKIEGHELTALPDNLSAFEDYDCL